MKGIASIVLDGFNGSFWLILACECHEEYSHGVGCDVVTGQCHCLPGVVGSRCESCPYRWALIEGYGCIECTECVHALLNDMDDLHSELRPVMEEFKVRLNPMAFAPSLL